MRHQLTETELEQIFINSRHKKSSPQKVFFTFVGLFIIFFAIATYLLNFSAYNQKISWWYMDEFGTHIHSLADAVSNYQAGGNTTGQNSLPNISDNSIYIESLNIKAPITFGIENSEVPVSEGLKNGAVQISGTSLPGEMGNVFLTGHSSNYPWVKSQYNSVFALLSSVSVGDLVQIKFQNINYVYRIKNIFVVDPSDISVMKSDNSQAILTLMTCSPVGTNLKRLIVQADQIIPPVSQNPKSNSPGIDSMPTGIH